MDAPDKKKREYHRSMDQKKTLGKTRRDLTYRARKIVKALMDGQSQTQALLTAGYSLQTAKQNQTDILKHPIVQAGLRKIYDDAGITDEFLADKNKALIHAKKVHVFNDKDSGIVYSLPLEDNTTQINAVKLAHQVKGNLIEVDQGDVNLQVNIVNFNDG